MTTMRAEKILGLSGNYDEKALKKSYRNKVVKFHPDNAKNNGLTTEEATRNFQMINEAFELLSKNLENKNRYSSTNKNSSDKSQDSEYVDVSKYTTDVASMLRQQLKEDEVVLKKLKSRFTYFDDDFWEMCYSYIDKLRFQINYFDFTLGGNLDSVIKQNQIYATKRRELLFEINKLFWNNYCSTILEAFKLKDEFLNYIEKNNFFHNQINFVSFSAWGDFIFDSVEDVEGKIKDGLKKAALKKIKAIISSYSDKPHYSTLKDYLGDLGILLYNSLNLEDIPLEHANDFITVKTNELSQEIQKTFINYNIFMLKEIMSKFIFGDTDIFGFYDNNHKSYPYLKAKSLKRNFANRSKDTSN